MYFGECHISNFGCCWLLGLCLLKFWLSITKWHICNPQITNFCQGCPEYIMYNDNYRFFSAILSIIKCKPFCFSGREEEGSISQEDMDVGVGKIYGQDIYVSIVLDIYIYIYIYMYIYIYICIS
ncbi:hypothetical protein RchiOBHm_Chr7g0233801 [Rosa chinensis]|uniref:Uncharacterized protein n=1 Tax=Rosa chinensis TaxID=74649 RepID=A0A2P6PGA1_ROSCH|nr:hypothetical protein RchiOBHm_Chr7g0233801 [Rosa chinensis]